jgi:hypothetical protein
LLTPFITTITMYEQHGSTSKPVVTFADLMGNGVVTDSSWESVGYCARLTIKHPNGHEYLLHAWSDGRDANCEDEDGVVDFTEGDEIIFAIQEEAYDRQKKAERAEQLDLLDAARGVLANWQSGDLAAAVRDLASAVADFGDELAAEESGAL